MGKNQKDNKNESSFSDETSSLLMKMTDDETDTENNDLLQLEEASHHDGCVTTSEGLEAEIMRKQHGDDKKQTIPPVVPVTFFSILRSNRPFRLFILSYTITQIGEWFTYVASIELMEQILGPERSANSRRYVSYLVLCKLMPFLVISPFGGVLADVRDRRKSMILLDCIGALPTLLFLLAAHFMSIPFIFAVTIIQASIATLYEPCRNAILPLLVPESEAMKKATTLTGLAWSVTAAFGAAMGGIMVSLIGIRACFGTFFIVMIIFLKEKNVLSCFFEASNFYFS